MRGSARFNDARYFVGAPTRDQAKRIYWGDLKKMFPPQIVEDKSESELMIELATGTRIFVIGMDKPERIEGTPWDGCVLDEYANMKAKVWGEHVRPALSDRLGWCDFIGVPEGRNHYYELSRFALQEMAEKGEDSAYGHYSWPSADILPESEIEAAKADLDELTYDQEYNASFVNFSGRAYYPFIEATHTARIKPLYNTLKPLILCFDFNVEPGVAAIAQEMTLPTGKPGTGCIGEVYIPRNSNTPAVCRKIAQQWGNHAGNVVVYGDASGGARGSAKVNGSDWDLIKFELRKTFGNRVHYRVPSANPAERSRINAMNTRIKAGNGHIRLMVDPVECKWLVKDLEGVQTLTGGAGEIDKAKDRKLSHMTDALGYYISKEFPVRDSRVRRASLSIG
jgi:hypothetical protein